MKKYVLFLAVLIAGLVSFPMFSQTDNEPVALGLPGDNLNLYAVLDIFQKSKTLEDFENALNDKDNKINNLDLNNDGEIDYIRVVSQKNGNNYSIVLQDGVNSNEMQDVAVIEVNKDKNNNVHVQIIGDEDLYGKNYIVEPASVTSGTPNPGYKGDATVIVNNNNTTNNYNTTTSPNYVTTSVSAWPVVLFMFSPLFVPYVSPWHWGYYPSYWRPWRPVYYHDYWGYHGHYYNNRYYRRTTVIRNPRYYNTYVTRRNTSVVVRDNRVNGRYNTTYNGRTYRKPAPVTSTRPNTRPGNTRPGTTRPTNPTTRPGGTRPANPSTTRPGGGTRPTNPSTTRPGGTRPVTPTQPVTRPTTRPVTPTNPSTRPVVRPTQPTTRPVQPTARPTATPRPTTRPTATPRPTNRGGSERR